MKRTNTMIRAGTVQCSFRLTERDIIFDLDYEFQPNIPGDEITLAVPEHLEFGDVRFVGLRMRFDSLIFKPDSEVICEVCADLLDIAWESTADAAREMRDAARIECLTDAQPSTVFSRRHAGE